MRIERVIGANDKDLGFGLSCVVTYEEYVGYLSVVEGITENPPCCAIRVHNDNRSTLPLLVLNRAKGDYA